MKFRTKILITFLSISISVIFIFVILQITGSSRYILTLEQSNLTAKSQIIQKQMDHYLEQTGNLVQSLGISGDIHSFLESGDLSDPSLINSYLDRVKQTSTGEFSAIFLTDKSGVCRASTDRRFIGTEYSFRTYYRQIITGKTDLFVSGYSIGLRSLIPGIFFSVPIKTARGEIIGVLILKISGQYLQSMIDALNTLEEAAEFQAGDMENIRLLKPLEHGKHIPRIFIINEDGIVIMDPDPERLFSSVLPLPDKTVERLKKSQQFLDLKITSLDEPVLAELHQRALHAGKPMAVVYRNEDEAQWDVLALAPLERNTWCVGVSLSYSEFRLFSRDLLYKTIIVSLIILGIVVAAAAKTTRIIIKPMSYLVEIIGDVMDKNWSIRLEVRGEDEFSYLGKRFNDLLDIIEDYSQNMEQQVRERTEEVINLQKENTRLKIIEEKERLYRDLHDSLGARLTNINICNTVALTSLRQDCEKVEEMIQRIEANCEQAIDEMKNLISREENSSCGEEFLGEEMIARFRRRLSLKGIEFETSLPHTAEFYRLNGEASHELREILEELITNVLKHSHADFVSLRGVLREGSFEMEFYDNGVGIDDSRRSGGFGLGNIEKRVNRLKGTLNIKTDLGKGTEYAVSIPFICLTEGVTNEQ